MPLNNWLIRTDKNVFLRIAEFRHRLRNIFRDINHHGPRSAACGNLERLFNGFRQLIDVRNQEIVFDARTGNTHRINFLERIRTNQGIAYLPADDHHRNRIRIGSSNTGQCIGNARAGCNQCHAHLTADARIRICRVYCRLLVTGQNVLEFIELEKGIVDFDNRTAGITENVLDTLRL